MVSFFRLQALPRRTLIERPAQNTEELLRQVREGEDPLALSRLVEHIQRAMLTMAKAKMRRERAGHTLQATALVHETVIRLLETGLFEKANDREHLFATVALAMTRILVEHARRKGAKIRGGDRDCEILADYLDERTEGCADVLDVHEALADLKKRSKLQAEIANLRFFCGWTMQEISQHLREKLSCVESEWRVARAWLTARLEELKDAE